MCCRDICCCGMCCRGMCLGTSWGSAIFLSARWTLQSQGSPREWNKCHNWESFDFHFCRGPCGSFEVWTCIATMNSRVHSCSQSKSQTMNSRVHSCCAGQHFKKYEHKAKPIRAIIATMNSRVHSLTFGHALWLWTPEFIVFKAGNLHTISNYEL